MCGRYALTSAPEAIRKLFGYPETPNFPPRYNIAPTQPIAIVTSERQDGKPTRRFMLARWGFLPGFAKDPSDFPLIFNARSETVLERASFRAAMKRRRCLVPADAYYEWLKLDAARKIARKPYLFRRADGAPMGMAGLWETYAGADGSEIDTACILTTAANAATIAVHERMPAVLESKDFAAWLDCDGVSAEMAAALLRPAADDALEFFEIAPAVNKATEDGPHLQEPLGRTLFG
ncbi:SOS response-associated peptidase [Methylocystis sp. MJC1]|jgi:putative SOS response-associated peptidase YedK|uniref:SOS response-associated peptidase n=1 Tax=Methylocystis sp. MJC1 TaxID=2654282 RepID=UPI0013EA2658|nr:SOS response-associated peptidase [Methylocystis sp. MJC1]KAF2990500.1 putative SOS response-associated peptidase YedK [Methylocystis sp. MJC1]MBU6525836.1 SOS response-associated peptidase [Methylocystis sp. MJC1]UZX12303.1 SOS response-associated peptidase [Methylocystis sp. MJC1]